ncbi:MAG: hypothetical protein JST65_13345 [Acidobacteria bacterium]|nr:hypothetical protein [Acidobacteriota bacterium]
MQPVDLNKLNEFIDEQGKTAVEQTLYRDMFAVACYLSRNGEEIAAKKLCRTLFEHLGFNGRKTYFLNLMNSFSGNERIYAEEICAQSAINDLFDRQGSA